MPDDFNMSMRKFLKTVGVTSQQKIEEAIRSAKDSGSLPAGPIKAKVVLTLEGLDIEHTVEGEISAGDA